MENKRPELKKFGVFLTFDFILSALLYLSLGIMFLIADPDSISSQLNSSASAETIKLALILEGSVYILGFIVYFIGGLTSIFKTKNKELNKIKVAFLVFIGLSILKYFFNFFSSSNQVHTFICFFVYAALFIIIVIDVIYPHTKNIEKLLPYVKWIYLGLMVVDISIKIANISNTSGSTQLDIIINNFSEYSGYASFILSWFVFFFYSSSVKEDRLIFNKEQEAKDNRIDNDQQ